MRGREERRRDTELDKKRTFGKCEGQMCASSLNISVSQWLIIIRPPAAPLIRLPVCPPLPSFSSISLFSPRNQKWSPANAIRDFSAASNITLFFIAFGSVRLPPAHVTPKLATKPVCQPMPTKLTVCLPSVFPSHTAVHGFWQPCLMGDYAHGPWCPCCVCVVRNEGKRHVLCWQKTARASRQTGERAQESGQENNAALQEMRNVTRSTT